MTTQMYAVFKRLTNGNLQACGVHEAVDEKSAAMAAAMDQKGGGTFMVQVATPMQVVVVKGRRQLVFEVEAEDGD